MPTRYLKPTPPSGRPKRSMGKKLRRLRERWITNRPLTMRAVGVRGLPMPPKFKTTLTYVQEGVTTGGGTGALSYFTYALNSTYDPYVTAGGHQPMGYDQLMALYNFCRVDKCKIICQFTPGTTNTDNPSYCGIQITENSAYAPSSLAQIVERGNCNYVNVPNNAGYNGKPIIVRRTWNASTWYPKYQKYDEQFSSTASAGPSGELCYVQVFAIGPNQATYSNVYYRIELLMDVEFYGQLQLDQS